jgi:sec-independent protein translocase protein TatA
MITKGEFNMPTLGVPELLIILVIVILLFGVGRISRVSSEIGKGIRSLRKGLNSEDETENDKKEK